MMLVHRGNDATFVAELSKLLKRPFGNSSAKGVSTLVVQRKVSVSFYSLEKRPFFKTSISAEKNEVARNGDAIAKVV
jgi:hypothetical protein